MPHVWLTFDEVHNALCLPQKNDSYTSKGGPNPSFFCTFDFDMCFTPKRRALFRHVNFQKWSLVCFVNFALEMCFAPQRRPLFPHLNFQKWSQTDIFNTFDVLRTTMAGTFSTSQLPNVMCFLAF